MMRRIVMSFLLGGLLAGCATVGTLPTTPTVQRGHSIPPLDVLANVLALPKKLLFLNWRMENHHFSDDSNRLLAAYLAARGKDLDGLTIRLNQYAPLDDLKHLVTNRTVAWPYRIFPGLPLTLLSSVLLPGRLFGGDHYDPYTHTVHLYSDDPAIMLHELGHAKDFMEQDHRGTYSLLRLLPIVDLAQEHTASAEAINYFIMTQDEPNELRAYKTLYPALGSYVGGYIPHPIGYFTAIIGGHMVGRVKAVKERKFHEHERALQQSTTPSAPPSPTSSP